MAVYTDYEELVSYVMCLVDFQVIYSGLEPISWNLSSNQTWSFGSVSLFSTKCVGSLWTVSNIALQHPEIYTGQPLHTYLPQGPTFQKPYCIFIFLQSYNFTDIWKKKQRYGKMKILTNNPIRAFTNPVQFLKFRYKATPAQLGWEEERKKE